MGADVNGKAVQVICLSFLGRNHSGEAFVLHLFFYGGYTEERRGIALVHSANSGRAVLCFRGMGH